MLLLGSTGAAGLSRSGRMTPIIAGALPDLRRYLCLDISRGQIGAGEVTRGEGVEAPVVDPTAPGHTEHVDGVAAGLSTKHGLALTNRGSARAADVLALAREIRDGVQEAFGVRLVNEPVLVGCEL